MCTSRSFFWTWLFYMNLLQWILTKSITKSWKTTRGHHTSCFYFYFYFLRGWGVWWSLKTERGLKICYSSNSHIHWCLEFWCLDSRYRLLLKYHVFLTFASVLLQPMEKCSPGDGTSMVRYNAQTAYIYLHLGAFRQHGTLKSLCIVLIYLKLSSLYLQLLLADPICMIPFPCCGV